MLGFSPRKSLALLRAERDSFGRVTCFAALEILAAVSGVAADDGAAFGAVADSGFVPAANPEAGSDVEPAVDTFPAIAESTTAGFATSGLALMGFVSAGTAGAVRTGRITLRCR